MSKFQEWKEYVTSPPPELIAKVEYRSEILGALGILIVCGILIAKGFWWAILAMIFSIGGSWARGMSAYGRYKVFNSFKPEETYEYILEDISFTRRKQRLLVQRYPFYVRYLILPSNFILAVGTIGFKKIVVDYSFKLWDITVFVWSNYVFEVFILTLLFHFIFTYLIVGGLIEKIKRDEIKRKAGTIPNA
jgi:hypothetical protein